MAKRTNVKRTVEGTTKRYVESMNDPLDALTTDTLRVIALMLWKERFRNPELAVKISDKDLKGMDDCLGYLRLKLDVRIERGAGIPAHPGNPAKGIPAREAGEPQPYVVVSLLGKDENDISGPVRPVENNEEDHKQSQIARQVAQARDQAQYLGQRLINAARSGDYSSSELAEAGQALMLLAKA